MEVFYREERPIADEGPFTAEECRLIDIVAERVGRIIEHAQILATADAHPMHIHEVLFQVVNRQAIFVDEANKTFQVVPGSWPTPPEPWENGWKDTVIAYPGQVTRVRMRFEVPGQYVWHCHIVEHEDNEMMRPYRIGPPQPGQPD